MGWLRDIDRWFIGEVLPHTAAYRTRAAQLCGRDEADDLVQEAYARVLATPHYRQIQAPRAFVLTIVRHLALERLRRAQVVRIEAGASLHLLDVADPAPDAFAVAAARSDLAQLAEIIATLPPQCARVLHMRKVQCLSPTAIAAALSLSVSTVEKHIAKGVALMTQARRDRDALAEEACPAPKQRATI